jgi:formylglycine-generating enzyme required for sulfatase activity
MMNCEVTQKMYEALMPVPAYKNTNGLDFKNESYPVVNISWLNACKYANALSVQDGLSPVYTISGTAVTADWNTNGWRLPTEAEWEYAARAGGTTPFAVLGNFGNGSTLNTDMANYNGSAVDTNFGYNPVVGLNRQQIIAVRTFEPNAFGLYDMHGNAWEYCWDWYADYDTSKTDNPHGYENALDGWGNNKGNGNDGQIATDDKETRIIRGGSYYCSPRYLRSAHRGTLKPDDASNNDIGFRLVRKAP